MGLRIEEAGRACRVVIDGDLTVANAAEVGDALGVAVLGHDETEVDLAGVEEMDTAGLQIMLAAKRCAGRTVRFVNHSAAVLSLLELANLGQQLGDPLLFRAGDGRA